MLTRRVEFTAVVRRAVHPPLRDWRFWVIQAMVVFLAGLHLLVDLGTPVNTGAFPDGIPVALLIIPVGYAALRYGLAGSAATGLWATLLWLPDLLLPLDQGHGPSDLINLALVDTVAFVFGQKIAAERLAHARVEQATSDRLRAEAGYRQLFEANRAPTLVLDSEENVTGANPAARALFGDEVLGASASAILDGQGTLEALAGQVVTLGADRDYRVDLATLPTTDALAATQLVLEDVTDERVQGRRAARYAALVVAAEEDQRRRLARELHDEPLQLFLHLARRLESLEATTDAPGLGEARVQALDAAMRLRTLAYDLRPPALDQLGLVAALSSLLHEVEKQTGLVIEMEVTGTETRRSPEVELAGFRIIQEAVRNTVRHADALHLHVVVGFEPDRLVLVVADDGRGFVQGAADDLSSGHLGLLGMAERANLLGGCLDVESAPGEGTFVRAILPGVPPGTAPHHESPGRSRPSHGSVGHAHQQRHQQKGASHLLGDWGSR